MGSASERALALMLACATQVGGACASSPRGWWNFRGCGFATVARATPSRRPRLFSSNELAERMAQMEMTFRLLG
jgi:hypothetical protein